MNEGTSIAVVIVNYRSPDLTAAAVRSVLDEPHVSQVVVVDNGSTASSSADLGRLPTDARLETVASVENLGFGGGVNLGVAQTSAGFLFVLNSDATVAPGALAELCRAFDDDHLGAVAPLVVDAEGVPQADAYGSWFTLRSMLRRTNRHPLDTVDPDWLSGVALMFRRPAFEGCGGFDPDFFMYMEDVDLSRRLREAGWTLRRIPSVTVVHLGGRSLPSDEQRDAWYHESLVRAMQRGGQSRLSVDLVRVLHPPWQWLQRVRRRTVH